MLRQEDLSIFLLKAARKYGIKYIHPQKDQRLV